MGQILKMGMGKLSILVGLALLAFLAVQATENENKQLSASEDRAVEEGLLRGVRDAGRKKKKTKSKEGNLLVRKRRNPKRRTDQLKKVEKRREIVKVRKRNQEKQQPKRRIRIKSQRKNP